MHTTVVWSCLIATNVVPTLNETVHIVCCVLFPHQRGALDATVAKSNFRIEPMRTGQDGISRI